MKHTNRVLSAVLAAVMLVLAFPVIVLPVSAAEPAAQEVTYMDYKDMYVQDGLTILLDAYDPSNVDFANQTWASEVGSVVATIKGGEYNADSNKTGWTKGSKGISWVQRASHTTSTSLANGVYFDISELPAGEFTVENVIVYQGITNDDGTGWETVYNKGDDATKEAFPDAPASTAGRYGVNVADSFAYGVVRNISFINFTHTTYMDGVEKISSDKRSTRWYYTGMKYANHSTTLSVKPDLDGDGNTDGTWTYGATINSNETKVATYGLTDIYTYATTYDYVGGDTYETATSAVVKNWYDGVAATTATINAGTINGAIGDQETFPYAETLLPNDAGYTRTGLNDDKTIKALSAHTDGNKLFNIMKGVAGSIYSIRVYDKVLTTGEMAMNHLADLCAYYEIEVPVLPGNFTYATVADSYKTVALGSLDEAGVAALQAAIDGYATSLEYAQLYVQDGLNLLLLAYNDSVSTADIAGGTWVNLVGAQNGVIVDNSSVTSWTANDAANGGGITYKYDSIENYSMSKGLIGLDLPADAIGNGDTTVETVFIPHYVGDGTTIIPHSNAHNFSGWGAYWGSRSNFTVGTIHLAFFQPSVYRSATATYTGSSSNFRVMVCNGNGHESYKNGQENPFCTYEGAALLGGYSVVNDSSYNVTVSDKNKADHDTLVEKNVKDTMIKDVTSFVITRNVDVDKSYSYTVKSEKTTYSKTRGAEYYATNDAMQIPFTMFYGFASTVYAIRAYDRALSDSELMRNKVVDVFAKTGADVSALLALDEGARTAILTACADSVSYTMSAVDAQAILDEATESTFIPDRSKDAYSDLYVQDGLTALYNAFDGGEKTVDFANGIWYATGSDAFITLNGDKWEESNGGIGYRMQVSEWSGSTSSDYIDLGSLTSNDFTVEIAQTMVGLTTAEGERESITWEEGMDHKYGYYATKYSSYDFGYLKGTSFVAYVSSAGSGNLCTRISFNPGHWGDDNGKYWLSDFSWKDASYATVPVTYAYTQASGLFDREVPVYNMENRNNATKENPYEAFEGVTYVENGVKGYDLTVYENGNDVVAVNTVTSKYGGNSQYNRAVTYVDAEGAEQTGYIEYLSAAEAGASSIGKAMKVMNSMPGDVYAIRMYDRALSAEEAEWNSLVDIAAYVGANVDALAGIGDAQKASLGAAAATANLSYASTAAEVEAAIAQGVSYLATYAPEALGYQKGTDNTSLRIWATANLATVQGASKLGMEIKVTGDAEKVLSGETDRVFLTVKNGEDVVCPEKADTFYFAAIVDGIPEDQSFTFTITPYAIVDGAKVYGESVTLEWPAVE